MRKADILKTFEYLDGHFQTRENGKLTINKCYLLDSITMWVDNTESLITAITKDRHRKVESVVFEGLIDLCNNELKHSGNMATNYHIKKWFEKYGLDYKEELKPLVDAYKEEREESLK